jgi:hypothetical protein
MTAEQWVDLLIRRGGELRAAGVLRISAEGYSVALAPLFPETEVQADGKTLAIAELDPLEDPITFGGSVPGYDIPERRDDEDHQ